LLQSTETCKNKEAACSGGKYDPARSPRFAELPPRYNTGRMNRNDGPEDSSLPERCLTGGLPEFGGPTGSFRRIVQTPGGISIFYDVGQGQGWQRNIVMNGSTHLPASIRQWYGDSRGHWEGNTLVIDVMNFSPKTDFQGSRENLHLVERWTRTGLSTLEYEVTIEDATVWARPWTVKEEFTRQSEQDNRLYTEPRCVEGNYGLPGIILGRRMQELAFAQGRGPDPGSSSNIKPSLIAIPPPIPPGLQERHLDAGRTPDRVPYPPDHNGLGNPCGVRPGAANRNGRTAGVSREREVAAVTGRGHWIWNSGIWSPSSPAATAGSGRLSPGSLQRRVWMSP
jgi:hypothetical protein